MREEIDSEDMDDLLSAAHKINAKLGGSSGGEYRNWLKESVGTLPLKRRGVIEAIRDLGAPIATTNYDGLLEEVTKLEPVTWQEHARTQNVVQGREQAILHLHGYHRQPDSVVLGIKSYEQTKNDDHAQVVLRALALSKILIFIGFGAGLRDPNFGPLLQWREQTMPGAEARSYRLALEGEREALQKEHPQEQRILVLSYGARHQDLEAFLRKLVTTRAPIPAPVSPAAAPSSLPAPRACYGRDTEIDRLVQNLLGPQPAPFPVLGAAGIGKSTITIAALHHPQIAARLGASRYFVRCEAATTRLDLAAAIGRQLGIAPSPGVEAAVLAALSAAPALLVLDNFETPWEADQSAVEEALGQLGAVPGLALVVSIRANERPAGVQWAEALRPHPLDPIPARQAFLQVAGSQFATDPFLDTLLNAVDRVPLAVTLLAHAAEPEPNLQNVWRRWQTERTAMLKRGAGSDRLSNLELSYEISLKGPRMTEDARQLLSVLALLPNGAASAQLEAITPSGAIGDATLLRSTGMAYDDGRRLRLYSPVREYVARRYPANPEDAGKVAQFYRNLIREHGGRVGRKEGADAVALLAPEARNIEEMLLRRVDGVTPDEISEAAKAWAEFSRYTGMGSPRPIAFAADQIGSESHFALAESLEALGDLALSRSDHARARQAYERARALYRQVPSLQGEANCIFDLGTIARVRSDFPEARRLFAEALPFFRQLGDVLGEANCIRSLGLIAEESADSTEARQRYEEALPLYRAVKDWLGEASCIFRLGRIAHALAAYGDAQRQFDAALPLFRQIGSVRGEANGFFGLGDVARALSQDADARQRYEQALALYQRLEDQYSIGGAHRQLARLATSHDRARHVQAAREAWLKADRPDLVRKLDEEFGPPPAASATAS